MIIIFGQFQTLVVLEVMFTVLEHSYGTHLIVCMCTARREKRRGKGGESAKKSVLSSLLAAAVVIRHWIIQ